MKSQPTPKKGQPTPRPTKTIKRVLTDVKTKPKPTMTIKKVTKNVTVKKPSQTKNVAPDRSPKTNKKYVPPYNVTRVDRA